MSWWIVGGMAALSAAGIGSKNAAASKAFDAQNAAYTLQQQENNIRMYEATEEARRAGALAILDEKPAITEATGKEVIRRGEGATAGVSASRSVQVLTINAEKAISKEQTKQRKELINMWQQNEQTNQQIQQAKEGARQQAKQGMSTGMQSAMTIAQGGLQGYMLASTAKGMFGGLGSGEMIGTNVGMGADATAIVSKDSFGLPTNPNPYSTGSGYMYNTNTQSVLYRGGY